MSLVLAEGADPLASSIQAVVNTLLFMIGAVSVIMIIIGGIRYAVSGGDAGAVSAAKNTVLYAITGLVTAIASYALVNFAIGRFVSEDEGPADGFDWATAAVASGTLSAAATLLASLRRSSSALRAVLRLTARTAAILLPRAERAAYVERTHAMILHAGRWERAELIWDLLMGAAAMGARRRHARKLLEGRSHADGDERQGGR